MAYVLPSDIATYLETALTLEQQAKATDLIAGAEDSINRATNRSWNNGASHTEYFDGGTIASSRSMCLLTR